MERAQSARQVAHVTGRVLYRKLMQYLPQPGGSKMLRILSAAGKYQAKHGWDSPGFLTTLGEEQIRDLHEAWAEVLANDWISYEAGVRRRVVFVATDASDEGFGYVIFTPFDSSEGPPARHTPTASYRPEKYPSPLLASTHIYVREIHAACEGVKRPPSCTPAMRS